MLDQMFNAHNFRQIFDLENRKGFDLVAKFFPELESETFSIREKVKEIRELRKSKQSYSVDEFKAKLGILKGELVKLKDKKSGLIDKKLEEVSEKVLKNNFKINLIKKTDPNGKDIYCIDETAESFFVIKQLQRNIRKLYGVKQSSRHDVISRLRDTLSSSFHLQIVKTDISGFYESIDRSRILRRFENDQLLTPVSRKLIKQILDSYGELSGEPKGIPRGVGISAYLAELYLRAVDREVKQSQNLVLYCRYVDDIVAIYSANSIDGKGDSYQQLIFDALNKQGLTSNPSKTVELKIADLDSQNFEYLGYRFFRELGRCKIDLSQKKIDRYKCRIETIFEWYEKQSSVNSRRAFRTLVARVKFLTGNARLLNSKSNAVTGIYYSNTFLTELSTLESLDKVLKAKIKSIPRKTLRQRLKVFNFSEGFNQKRFHNFSAQELKIIVEAWKHG